MATNDDAPALRRLPLLHRELARWFHGVVLRHRQAIAHGTPVAVLEDGLAHIAEENAHPFEGSVVVRENRLELFHAGAEDFSEVADALLQPIVGAPPA